MPPNLLPPRRLPRLPTCGVFKLLRHPARPVAYQLHIGYHSIDPSKASHGRRDYHPANALLQAKQAAASTRSPSLTYATIVSQHPLRTAPKDIIQELDSLESSGYPRDLIVLVSRGFAHWLLEADDFLPNVVNRIFPQHWNPSVVTRDVNVLVAVVDQVTCPQGGDDHDCGREGIAYFSDVRGTLIELDDPTHSAPQSRREIRQRDLAPEKPASILFQFVSHRHYETIPTCLELGLANTIFSNGSPFILAGSVWTRDSAQGKLSRTSTTPYKNISVFFPVGHLAEVNGSSYQNITEDSAPRSGEAMLSIPLQPLTPRRVISASMGNVIRGIEGAESGASKELEDAVSQYFVDHSIEPQAAAVWALVDADNTSHNTLSSKPNHGNVALALWNGATLHKVLSGGGGWGTKAGLLSLDPDNGFGVEDAAEQARGEEAAFRVTEEFAPHRTLVRDIVTPGDGIQFFITPYSTTVGRGQPGRTHAGISTTVEFGVAPSSMNEMPLAIDHTDDTADTVTKLSNHFGILSELGISLARNPLSPRRSAVSRTKIDVPFSRFRF